MSRDEGSTLPLTIFFGMLSLALILVVVASTSLYLERKRLFSLADAAALVGAESFDLADVTAGPDGFRPTLRSPDVAAAVTAYLSGIPIDLTELTLEKAATLDGRSATVTLSAVWHAPVLETFLPEGVRIEVTSVARSVFD